jgi:hypothetical protein
MLPAPRRHGPAGRERHAMSDIRRFDPPGMRFPGMSQAVRCGEWITVSG